MFWLASGTLSTYEIIINGISPSNEAEEEVEECLKDQDWWEEIQKIRGNRGPSSGTEDLAEIASLFSTASVWPESSFQQGPRGERAERFLGLRKLMKRSKKKHTMSGITRLGVSLGMRTHRLSDSVVSQHGAIASASEDSDSEEDDSSVFGDSDEERPASVASEGDIDDFESDSSHAPSLSKLKRRRSHGDSLRGPPPSKKSTGEREIRVPERTPRKSNLSQPPTPTTASGAMSPNITFNKSHSPTRKPASTSNLASSLHAHPGGINSKPPSLKDSDKDDTKSPRKSEPSSSRPSNTSRPSSVRSLKERPSLSRHASQPKFSSKPVPMTRVATEDGPGPSIMFTDTPSPPTRRANRAIPKLPSAYRSLNTYNPSDRISEVSEPVSPTNSRRGSTYSTQSVPLSFNDLPCRAQHLILNQLMRRVSGDGDGEKKGETAVMFTTLPSPVEGTCSSVEASEGYLGDLEVLCKGCPPVLLVHSNSMTVTMSL